MVGNSLEALVSLSAGIIAGSVALVGFGLNSVIEVASGAALVWRLQHDLDARRRAQVERTTLRIVGWCFIALAVYIIYESGSTLIRHEAPDESIGGIVIAAASSVAMPLLARAESRVTVGMESGVLLSPDESICGPVVNSCWTVWL